jgi:flagella basal body P-ring formation protein FlgA
VRKGLAALGILVLFSSFALADLSGPADLLRQYLKDNYPWEEVELKDIRLSGEFPGTAPEAIVVEKAPPGRTVFRLRFDDGRTITATARVSAFDRVVKTRRPFRKGHSLGRADVYETLMNVRRIPRGALKSSQSVVGKKLTRSVVANMPVVDSMVSDSAMVKRGQKVVLVLQSEGFKIEVTGEMKDNSRVGSYVKAVNPASKKVITGLLVDESTVEVEF